MQEITIKGIKQLYVTKNEVIPMTLKEGDVPIWYIGGMPEFMQTYIRTSNDVRAIVTLTYDQSAFVQYVYWYFQDVNLDELDRKVTLENSEALEQYFNSIVVVHYQRTRCIDGCKKCFHTLDIRHVLDYHSDNRSALDNQHIQILNCPNCGKSFRQPVIKIMSEFVEG